MVYKRILKVSSCIFLACLLVTNGYAANFKMGFVNRQKIVNESDAGKALAKQTESKLKKLQATFDSKEKELKELQTEINIKSSAWSQEKKQEKIDAFNKARIEVQNEAQKTRFELQRAHNEKSKPILLALDQVIGQHGQDNGYRLILDINSGVIAYASEVDELTDVIIEKLDKALAKK